MAIDYKNIVTLEGQSLMDVCIQEYGCANAHFILYSDNTDVLPYFNIMPEPGTSLRIRKVMPAINSTNKQKPLVRDK